MRTLTLIRHGKSAWDDPTISDWERPLKDRGKRDALLIGNKLKDDSIVPDKIVSSSAKRAYDTAKRVAECVDYKETEIVITDDIYFATMDQLIDIIKNLNDDWEHIFLFGHNPYFTDFVNKFGDGRLDNLPTTGVYQIKFDCNKWQKISTDNGKNTYFITPKELKEVQ